MFINLKLVQQRSLLGETIVRNYHDRPAETLRMIREQFKDNPEVMTEIIGPENVQALGLTDPLAKFQYYFPKKKCEMGLHGLVYTYGSLKEVFDALKTAKSMIRDLGLELGARSQSRRGLHKLYIDK